MTGARSTGMTAQERRAALDLLLPLEVLGLVRVGDPDVGPCQWHLRLADRSLVRLGGIRAVVSPWRLQLAIAERKQLVLTRRARLEWERVQAALLDRVEAVATLADAAAPDGED